MSKERIIFILGVIVIILPFLGFPNSWRKFFFILIGLGLAYLAYHIRKERKAGMPSAGIKTGTYTENQVNS